MNDFNQQNTSLEDDEPVQITDLGPAGTSRQRLAGKLVALLHKSAATPWIRYSLLGLLLCILLGTLVLQNYRAAPTTPTTAIQSGSGHTPLAHEAQVSLGSNQVYIQASDGTVTAYQAENGHVLWRNKLPGQANLLASGRVIYIYGATTADNGLLEALNGDNGRVLWRHAMPAPGTNATLEQSGDALYAADHDDTIHAFQASNGHLRWTYTVRNQIALPIGNLLQVEDGIAEIFQTDHSLTLLHANNGLEIVHLLSFDGSTPLIALDDQMIYEVPTSSNTASPQPVQIFRASNGKLLWTWPSPLTSIGGLITAQNGTIYIVNGENYALTALRASDGHVLWTYPTSDHDTIIAPPTEESGMIYLFQQNAALQDTALVCLRATTGQPIWSTQTQVATSSLNLSPLVDSGMIFITTNEAQQNGQIYALRASDGHILWHEATTASLSGGVSAQAGILYTMQPGGQLDAWQERDGTHLWRYQISDSQEMVTGLTSRSDTVLLVDWQIGKVEALRVSDGKLIWRYPSS